MSTVEAPASTRPARRSGRVPVWLPIVSAIVFIAGALTFVIVYDVGGIRNTANVSNPVVSDEPAQVPAPLGKTMPLNRAAAQVAMRFIDSAVARRNLASSYALAGPDLRGGLSLAEWKTGNIPVQYFPLWEPGAGSSPYRILWSYKNEFMLQIMLVAKKGSGVRDQQFRIGVKRIGQPPAWKVTYFQPYWFPPRLTNND